MDALLHGSQHRKNCQLWIYIGCAERLSGADNKIQPNHQLSKIKFLKLRILRDWPVCQNDFSDSLSINHKFGNLWFFGKILLLVGTLHYD